MSTGCRYEKTDSFQLTFSDGRARVLGGSAASVRDFAAQDRFRGADLVYVVKTLAQMMGRNVYIGPGVEGSVTVHLVDVTPEEALGLILKQQENPIAYKLVGTNTLIVAAPEKTSQVEDEILGKSFAPAPPVSPSKAYPVARVPGGRPKSRAGAIRQEILLEKAPAAKVIAYLRSQYPRVELIPHPTMNGFYAVGPRRDILSLKNDVPNLDQVGDVPPPAQRELVDITQEQYEALKENAYFDPRHQPYSTFSIDVDTASYANVRRFLSEGRLPPQDSVRLEELLNYFVYDYAAPRGDDPIAVQTELGECPWAAEHYLLSVGLQARRLPPSQIPPRNLVFLLDVSGSMDDALKLPLLKQSLKLLVDQLRPEDRVGIVVYAGASGMALAPTSDKTAILAALDRLEAGGSTNGGAGIELAYKLAREHFHKNGINRVILCTDGDFNVGTTGQGDLSRLIEKERASGVFLSVLGYGMGNLKDGTLEKLADKGNGNYAYIDSLFEARKVLVEQAGGTLVPVANDVKVQVEFNPALVGKYRLLGYEDRMLEDQDFNNDMVDAGEMGSGQSVTALYELIPPGQDDSTGVDAPKYQQAAEPIDSSELANVKVRFKRPGMEQSELISQAVSGQPRPLAECSQNLRFASSVAAFANSLRRSRLAEPIQLSTIQEWASSSRGPDTQGYRADFIQLLKLAGRASARNPQAEDEE